MSGMRNQAIKLFNNGNKLFKSNLFDEAIEQYQKAFESDPTFFNVHFSIAKAYVSLDQYQIGINHYAKYANLIPKDKRDRLTIDLARILEEKGKSNLALELINSSNTSLTINNIWDLAPVYISNGKRNLIVHNIFNLHDLNSLTEKHKSLINKLDKSDDNIILRFFIAQENFKLLKMAGLQNKDYYNSLTLIEKSTEEIKAIEQDDYDSKISDTIHFILEAQNLLSLETEKALEEEDIQYSQKLIDILIKTKFNQAKSQEFDIKLKQLIKKRSVRNIKKGLIGIVSLALISITAFIWYGKHEKSSAYERALKSESIDVYTGYLNEYGDDDEIHNRREKKLYEKALRHGLGKDINKLNLLYPNSPFSHLISITVNPSDAQVIFSGINNDNLTQQTNSIRIPKGCKIRYSISAPNKVPMDRVFTVVNDLKIKENLIDDKTLVLDEKFQNNRQGWDTFQESKKVYGRQKNKGVKISENTLKLYNNYGDRKFTSSTIYLSKIKKGADFEITARIKRNGKDDGTFLLFGGTKRAFNYIGLNRYNYLYGYNNWDDQKANWIKQSDGWKRSNSINTGSHALNNVKILKKNKTLTYSINGDHIGQVPLKKWYGSRIGIGVNDNTNVDIQSLQVYKLNRIPDTEFVPNQIYYCWVDELNVRDNGSKKGVILTTIKNGDPVKYLGERGAKILSATFKKSNRPDYYYKVELTDGTIGWAHGGALFDVPSIEKVSFEDFKPYVKISESNIVTKTQQEKDFYVIATHAEKTFEGIKKRIGELKNHGFTSNYLWIPDYKSLSGSKMYCAYVGPYNSKVTCKEKLIAVRKQYPKAYGILVSKENSTRVTIN